MCDPNDAMVATTDLFNHFLAIIGTPVIDEDDFIIDVELLKDLNEALIHDRDRLGVFVTGNNRRDALILVLDETFRGALIPTLVRQVAIPLCGQGKTIAK